MEHVQELRPLFGQKQPVAPLRVTTVQPSMWKRVTAKVEKTLSVEKSAEIIFGAATVLLTAGLFVSLARAVAHYTIIPVP
jgi:hypothetical protein